jgi:ELWxxDGT repeat protein
VPGRSAWGQVPQLLKDLNVGSRRSVNLRSEFTPLGVMPTKPPTLLFSAWTEATGRELWGTTGDATSTSTRMLADHVPGPGSSDPGESGAIDTR